MFSQRRLTDPLPRSLPAAAAGGGQTAGLNDSLGQRQRQIGERQLIVVVALPQVDQRNAAIGGVLNEQQEEGRTGRILAQRNVVSREPRVQQGAAPHSEVNG